MEVYDYTTTGDALTQSHERFSSTLHISLLPTSRRSLHATERALMQNSKILWRALQGVVPCSTAGSSLGASAMVSISLSVLTRTPLTSSPRRRYHAARTMRSGNIPSTAEQPPSPVVTAAYKFRILATAESRPFYNYTAPQHIPPLGPGQAVSTAILAPNQPSISAAHPPSFVTYPAAGREVKPMRSPRGYSPCTMPNCKAEGLMRQTATGSSYFIITILRVNGVYPLIKKLRRSVTSGRQPIQLPSLMIRVALRRGRPSCASSAATILSRQCPAILPGIAD